MNAVTEKIYLWLSKDAGLYDIAKDTEDWCQFKKAFLAYVRPFDEVAANGMAMEVLTDVLELVDWRYIWYTVSVWAD